eukprot:m51a1_g13718 putative rna helicase (609) ;mRNA; f:100970-102996
MAEDPETIFRKLAGGARFDKRRSGREMKIFSESSPACSAAAAEADAPLPSFFDPQNTPAAAKKRAAKERRRRAEHFKEVKERKRAARAQEQEAQQSDEDDVDEESAEQKKSNKRPAAEATPAVAESAPQEDEEDEDAAPAAAEEEDKKPQKKKKSVRVAASMRRLGLRVTGRDVPAPTFTFDEVKERLGLGEYLCRNLEEAGLKEPTPIQVQAIPAIAACREVIGLAPTGSGKTLAYTLPILHALKEPSSKGFRAVVMAPTKELAYQIYLVIKTFGKGRGFRVAVLTNVVPKGKGRGSAAKLQQHFDILVSPPLRMVQMIKTGVLDMRKVETLVFDEADRLFTDDFAEQVDEIVAACKSCEKLQVCLFSATMSKQVEALATSIMKDPIRISVGIENAPLPTIKQKLVFVGQEEGKLMAFRQLLQQGLKPPVIIFVQSKDRAVDLHKQLAFDGINVDVTHADLPTKRRQDIVDAVRTGKVWFLIATDIMARGMDFKGISCVINYDFPQSVESYVHRIGRTGRAGMPGEAVTFFTETDVKMLKLVANSMREAGCEVPDWMVGLPSVSRKRQRRFEHNPPERGRIGISSSSYLRGEPAKLPGKAPARKPRD